MEILGVPFGYHETPEVGRLRPPRRSAVRRFARFSIFRIIAVYCFLGPRLDPPYSSFYLGKTQDSQRERSGKQRPTGEQINAFWSKMDPPMGVQKNQNREANSGRILDRSNGRSEEGLQARILTITSIRARTLKARTSTKRAQKAAFWGPKIIPN